MNITEDFLKEIGKKIFEIRTKNKQTLDDLEFLTGIDSSDISKYEQGKINLTIRTLVKLSQALMIHPQDLLKFNFDFDHYKKDI
ncbi:helix-turn-helix transcriptional regulator [Chryseobacterium sp. KACC 21268]|nr:helix-turn-helix transcriptional regulator [Chryseobacterium sp. KACC 21268]